MVVADEAPRALTRVGTHQSVALKRPLGATVSPRAPFEVVSSQTLQAKRKTQTAAVVSLGGTEYIDVPESRKVAQPLVSSMVTRPLPLGQRMASRF